MPTLRTIADGLRSLFRKQRVDTELDEELRSFLEMAAEKKMKQGASREEALRAVHLEHGNLEAAKEVVRDARWESFLETCWRDLRFALRTLRKSPGFTAVAVLTLPLGIGANTAIFTLIAAVMLKSLPVPNPTQLYRLGDNNNCCVMTGTQNEGSFVLYSYPLYEDLRDHTAEFTDLAAFESHLSDLSVRHEAGWFGDRSSAVQKTLVIAQVAFSSVLLIGAGLVTQSPRNLEQHHFGFVTEGHLILNIAPSLTGYTADKLDGLYQRPEKSNLIRGVRVSRTARRSTLLPAVPTAQFDRFPDRRSFSAVALTNIAAGSKGMSHAKKAWRMSFVFTAENRSQFNLVRPHAVGFQLGTHANSFGKPAQVWQMNSGT